MTSLQFTLTLLLATLTGIAFAGENRVVEAMIAPASADPLRNSEGDVVVLRDGTLLAAWTEFYGGGRDDSAARISAVRSTDGGQTWGEKFTLRENTGSQNVMSASFLRLQNGDLLLFYLEKHSPANLDVLVVRSADDGKSWSEPVLVTPEEGYFVMNNARVIQTTGGRLVAPVAFTREVWVKDSVFKTVCYLSDDNGTTWRRGKGECLAPKRGAMEPGVIEKADGSLLQYIRTQTGTQWFAESADGGETWSEAKPWTVASPESPATVAPLPEGRWLLVHNPTVTPNQSHGGKRTPLVAAVSTDEGATWSEAKPIETNPQETYAYTSIDVHEGRVLLTYYVRDESNGRISWKFKSLPASWFEK